MIAWFKVMLKKMKRMGEFGIYYKGGMDDTR